MTIRNDSYKLLEILEKEYSVFIEQMNCVESECVEIKIKSLKAPREILEEQIEAMMNFTAQRDIDSNSTRDDYSFEELKYIFYLVYINLTSKIEQIYDNSECMCEQVSYDEDLFMECFNVHLVNKIRNHILEMEMWENSFKNEYLIEKREESEKTKL